MPRQILANKNIHPAIQKTVINNHADIIRRFISFIDICYRENTKVKFFIDSKSIENLYKGTKLNILWNRCASRLKEMQTIEYLESSK